MALIGRRNQLVVSREASPGLYLEGGDGDILLPRRYVRPGIKPGDTLDVFVYLDSEDRLVATTERPRACVGDFAALKVVGFNRRVGAFLDWGLAKDLLLPFREQHKPVRIGQVVVAFVYLDERTHRIVASTRLNRHFSRDFPTYKPRQKVAVLVTGKTPLGYTCVVENSHPGLLYDNKGALGLEIGQKTEAFIKQVRPDGKIDLSSDESGYQRVAPLTERIVEAMQKGGDKLDMDDNSSPELIRDRFGVSKKAFKQALGALYKARRIRFEAPGVRLVSQNPLLKAAQKIGAFLRGEKSPNSTRAR